MKTDVYRFQRAVSDTGAVTGLAEKAAAYGGLDGKQTLRLVLLCEELTELLPNLLIFGNGEFWIESRGKKFLIHSAVKADDLLTASDRNEILKLSKSGRNAAASGIMNRIRIAAETMLANYVLAGGADKEPVYDDTSPDDYEIALRDPFASDDIWSLAEYRQKVKEDRGAQDELERSIIANIADDVRVGIIGGRVEVTIIKSF